MKNKFLPLIVILGGALMVAFAFVATTSTSPSAVRNSQAAIPNSQFAIPNSQFAIPNSQFAIPNSVVIC